MIKDSKRNVGYCAYLQDEAAADGKPKAWRKSETEIRLRAAEAASNADFNFRKIVHRETGERCNRSREISSVFV